MFLEPEFREHKATSAELPTRSRYLVGICIVVLGAALMFAIVDADKAAPNLAALAAEKLSLSGVENPVTAVLLNFRSYDTLLEIAVLLIVAVAILPAPISARAQSTAKARFLFTDDTRLVNLVLAGLLRWLVPLAIVLGGYLLWTGAYTPGGAFQAGAVIAGAGVALSLAGRYDFIWQTTGVRLSLSLGLLMFVMVAAANAIVTGTILQYPINYAGLLILMVEVAATVSIAAILLLLFTRLRAMVAPSPNGNEP